MEVQEHACVVGKMKDFVVEVGVADDMFGNEVNRYQWYPHDWPHHIDDNSMNARWEIDRDLEGLSLDLF